MIRIYEEDLAKSAWTPSPEAQKHLKVLRVKPGETVELFNGKGLLRRYTVQCGGTFTAAGECLAVEKPRRDIVLFACITKGSRWDWTIEKAVEIGATKIVPLISERTIVRLDAAERPAKLERWRRIALDAARQSDAAWLPDIVSAVDFKDFKSHIAGLDVYAGALLKPRPEPFLDALLQSGSEASGIGVFIGPEGDFTEEEMSALLANGVKPVDFGPTVLRAETAAVYALSVAAAAVYRRG